jgi:hypothetical protein
MKSVHLKWSTGRVCLSPPCDPIRCSVPGRVRVVRVDGVPDNVSPSRVAWLAERTGIFGEGSSIPFDGLGVGKIVRPQ